MAWYKTGTVSVTVGQTSVTGTGTKFATNSRVGDGFRGPDGIWYEVTNVASETVIAIYPAYQGSTVSGSANYMIVPIQGYNKESADRLRVVTDGIADISADVANSAASAAAALLSENAAELAETNANTSKVAAAASATSATASATSATASQTSATASATNATASQTAAATSAAAALASQNSAATSATNASTSATNAATSATAANTSKVAAAASEAAALASKNSASTSETNAANSASTASTAATTATNAATTADADADRAELARDDAIAAAASVTGNLTDAGPWDASTGVYPTKPAISAFWKVTGNGSATDASVTITYGIGDTLMFSKPLEEFYKIDNTESVSSVGGFTGVVTKTQLGINLVDNTSDVNKPVSTAQATSIATKQGLHVNLTALSGLSGVADRLPYFTGAGALSLATLTSFGRSLIDDVDATTARTTLELGTAATANLTTSISDTTIGSVLKVRDFGLGTFAPPTTTAAIISANDLGNGFYRLDDYAGVGLPSGVYSLINQKLNNSAGCQIATDFVAGVTYTRNNNGSGWLAWKKILTDSDITTTSTDTTAGRIMKVGDFGLGVITAQTVMTTFLQHLPTGVYRAVGGTTISAPFTSASGIMVIAMRYSTTDTFYIAQSTGRYFQAWYNTTNGLSNWVEHYTPTNIVGAVAQTAGVPTGAIIQEGGNANGNYTRYADGTQICSLNITVTDQAIDTAYGALFQGTRTWTFPASFIAGPAVAAPSVRWGSGANWGSLAATPGVSSAIFRFFDNVSRPTGTSTNINAVAVGRWF